MNIPEMPNKFHMLETLDMSVMLDMPVMPEYMPIKLDMLDIPDMPDIPVMLDMRVMPEYYACQTRHV